MLIPIRCFTCKMPVGDVDDLFRSMRAARVRETLAARGTTPTQAAVDGGLQLDCSDILEKLGVRHSCCRKTLVTGMVFSDYF